MDPANGLRMPTSRSARKRCFGQNARSKQPLEVTPGGSCCPSGHRYTAAFLASEKSSNIMGACLDVTGGMLIEEKEMSVDLSGRTCVVTGSAKSIGLGVVEMYCSLGAKVAMIDINPDVLKEADRLAKAGHAVRGYVGAR